MAFIIQASEGFKHSAHVKKTFRRECDQMASLSKSWFPPPRQQPVRMWEAVKARAEKGGVGGRREGRLTLLTGAREREREPERESQRERESPGPSTLASAPVSSGPAGASFGGVHDPSGLSTTPVSSPPDSASLATPGRRSPASLGRFSAFFVCLCLGSFLRSARVLLPGMRGIRGVFPPPVSSPHRHPQCRRTWPARTHRCSASRVK